MNKIRLFIVSATLLFLELALIRWIPTQVVYLTFFTNTVLLACFLGLSLGCLAARRRQDFLPWTGPILALTIGAAHAMDLWGIRLGHMLDVGHQISPQLVFFGTEYYAQDPARFAIPIEILDGLFFLMVALSLVGLGQELGRLFAKQPERIKAYTLNIGGSLAGIALFTGMSWLELSPFWWFLAAGAALLYLSALRRKTFWMQALSVAAILLWVHGNPSNYGKRAKETHPWLQGELSEQELWSPYYRINYIGPPARVIDVNLMAHQQMSSRSISAGGGPAYVVPHMLRKLAGAGPFKNVLIIGAGSGNDVSRALSWGAEHVDAVEIDPVIQRLGARDHPDRPYQDPRVTVHIADGRNFLRSTDKQYDLILYALVDSLVLHSSYSNIRLESYLFTQEAFEDVKRLLKPDGTFVMYNFFRQGWIVARLYQGLRDVFGKDPLVFPLPYHDVIRPDSPFNGFTILMAGNTEPFRAVFSKHPGRLLQLVPASLPVAKQPIDWGSFGLARVIVPDGLPPATDDWPFLYLHHPMIPDLSLRGMALMGTITLGLLALFMPKGKNAAMTPMNATMFFLGAGFMLIETRAVVQMALILGSTWMVNTMVFFCVLAMILLANQLVLAIRPARLGPWIAGLIAAAILNGLIPLRFFVGLPPILRMAGAGLLVFSPIFFAAVLFAVLFAKSEEPDRDFGMNVAGAIFGGLAEYSSMLVGFRGLMAVAVVFYIAASAFAKPAIISLRTTRG